MNNSRAGAFEQHINIEQDMNENGVSYFQSLKSHTTSRPGERLVPNAVTYTALIDAYAREGNAKRSEEILRTMIRRFLIRDFFLFVCWILAVFASFSGQRISYIYNVTLLLFLNI